MNAKEAREILKNVPDDAELVVLGCPNTYSDSRDCIPVRLQVGEAHKMADNSLCVPAKGSEKYYTVWQKLPIVLVI